MLSKQSLKKIPKKFYLRDSIEVAPELIGKYFCKKAGEKLLVGKIVEVEAYNGAFDEAAHTFIGKTERNKIMFEDGGHLYVYFTYGMYFCCNVVCGVKDEGQAVLIRGIQPINEIDTMLRNRFGTIETNSTQEKNITNGPGKICMAFNIKRNANGTDLTGNNIFLTEGESIDKSEIMVSKRIGIKKSADLPWRFFVRNNSYVTNHKFNKSAKPIKK